MSIDVGFNLVTDANGFLVGVAEAQKAQQGLSNEVRSFETQSKTSFKQSTGELNKFNIEIKNSTLSTGAMIKEVNNLGKTKSAVQALKAEIKFYTSEAIKAGEGSKAFAENLAKAGKLKDELEDINKAVSALNGNIGENFARAAGSSIRLASSGFEGLVAVEVLAGDNAKDFEQTLLRLQSLNAISRIAGEFGGLKDRLTEIKLGFKPISDLYTRGNEALKNFGKQGKLGAESVATGNKTLFGSLSGGIKSFVTAGITGVKSLWATVSANPLALILGLVTGLIVTMIALKDKVKPIGILFDYLGKVVNFLIAPFEKLAELTGVIADQAEKKRKAVIENTEKEIQALQSRYDYEKSLAEASGKSVFEIETKKYEDTRSRLNKTLQALIIQKNQNKKLDAEEVKSYEETRAKLLELDRQRTIDLAKEQSDRNKATQSFFKIINDSNINGIINDLQREKALSKQKTNDRLKALDEEFKKIGGKNDTEYRSFYAAQEAIIKDGEREITDIIEKENKKSLETKKKNNEALKGLQTDLNNAILDLIKRAEASQLSELKGEQRIQSEKQFALKEIEELRKKLIDKGQAEENFEAKLQKRKANNFELSLFQQRQFSILEQAVFNEASQKLIQLEFDRQNELAKAKAGLAKQNEGTLGTNENAEILAVGAIEKPQDVTEIDFEEQKQIAILNIQKKYAAEKFKLKQDSLNAEREELIKGFNGELSIIGNGEDENTNLARKGVMERLDATELEFIAKNNELKAGYDKINTETENQINKLNQKKPFNLAKSLGITESDLQNIISTIDNVTQILNQQLQAELSENNQRIEASKKKQAQFQSEIDSLRGKLENENELAQQGKANNINRVNEEIALKEEQKLKEEESEKQALERRKEIQKQQLLLNSISEASNLFLAASNIYAQASVYGPPGVLIASIAIGAMITGFAASKVAALKAINEGSNFKDGVFELKGPGTETSDSIPANLSRGETVFSAKQTRDNHDLFKGIYYNDNKLIHEGIKDLLSGRGISLIPDIKEGLIASKKEIKNAESNNFFVNNNKLMEKELNSMNSKFEQLIKAQNNKIYLDNKGNLVNKTGSHTQIIRKNND